MWDALGTTAASLLAFDRVPCDRESLSPDRLNLTGRLRTSLFAWRGQFSPELVQVLLEEYGHPAGRGPTTVLDPFAGSGTTLFEAARLRLSCYATEINPAAVEMASTAHFVNLPPSERLTRIRQAEAVAAACVDPLRHDLFSLAASPVTERADGGGSGLEDAFVQMLDQTDHSPLVRSLLANAVIRYTAAQQSRSPVGECGAFLRALRDHTDLVASLPYSDMPCRVFHADARCVPLPDASVDLVITSPPYINVFNYHQNSRAVMESMGWDLLCVARSEIGSNRKHRQNRFLTVVQYCLDMLSALHEMRRLLRPDGRAIIVVGRESTVRGQQFRNGRLVAALAVGGDLFRLTCRQERKFRNKFGDLIYEDLLHLTPASATKVSADFGRSVAVTALGEAAHSAHGAVRDEIEEAMNRAKLIDGSPLFDPHMALSASHGDRQHDRTREG